MAIEAGPDRTSDSIDFSLSAFEPEKLEIIHQSALDILARVGLQVEHATAAEIFQAGGAEITRRDAVYGVKLPASLVEECLGKAPKQVIYWGRDSRYDHRPHGVGFAAFGQCAQILESDSGRVRPSRKTDVARSARLQDALEHLCTAARTMAPVDQYPPTQAVHCLDALVRNTGKHISGGAGDGRNLEMMVRLLEVAAGGAKRFQKRPYFSPSFCPTSPLTLAREGCEVAIGAAQTGLGVVVMVMPLAGGSGPATLAGTVAQALAEQLASLVLVQLVRSGTPVTMGSATTIMDLKTGSSAMGAPEAGIVNSFLARMAGRYGLPARVACGVSDAKLPDAQSGHEYTVNALTAAYAGASVVFGGGGLESGLTHSPAKLLLDHECMGYIHRMTEGLRIDDRRLALDVIAQVGPGGHFLAHDHTYDHTRNQSRAELFDRRTRTQWQAAGGRTVTQTASARALEIISTHQPPPLPPGAAETMDEMVADFEARLRKDGSPRDF